MLCCLLNALVVLAAAAGVVEVVDLLTIRQFYPLA